MSSSGVPKEHPTQAGNPSIHTAHQPYSTTGDVITVMDQVQHAAEFVERVGGDDLGVLVKETPTHLICVKPMLFNWRLHTVRKPRDEYPSSERHWCYTGLGVQAFTNAYVAALAWDGSDDTEPPGWNKNGQTGEWRADE